MGLTNPKWLIGLFVLFVVLTLISGLLEGTYLGPGEVSFLQSAIRPPIFNPGKMIEWLRDFWRVLWFDYSMFHGSWRVSRYIFFWPISAGIVISFGALLVQAAIVALQALIPRIPGLR